MEHDVGYLNHAEAMMEDYSRVSIQKLAREYAEHMNAKLQARVDELEAALAESHDAQYRSSVAACGRYGLSTPDRQPHPLLADKEQEQ